MNRFIGGTNINQLKRTVDDLITNKHWLPIIDYAREACTTKEEVKAYHRTMSSIVNELDSYNRDMPLAYAIKSSSFQAASAEEKNYMKDICAQVLEHPRTVVMLDAEDDSLKNYERVVYSDLLEEFNKDEVRVYKTYQMYRRDSLETLRNDLETYKCLGVKLVRGAYMNADKHVVHKSINDTHRSYDNAIVECINVMRKKDDVSLLLATHNTNSVELGKRISEGMKDRVMFAQLLGMGDILSNTLVKENRIVYKYVPYGTLKETMPYLARRFKENLDIIKHMML